MNVPADGATTSSGYGIDKRMDVMTGCWKNGVLNGLAHIRYCVFR